MHFVSSLKGLSNYVFRSLPNNLGFIYPAPLQLFRAFFETNTTGDPHQDTATIITLEGRTYPVEVLYTQRPVADYLTASVETVLALHRGEKPGDVLVFLTGQDEVEKGVEQLK